MKSKQGGAEPQIKVITDPKKLAWLRDRIEKKRADVAARTPSKKSRTKISRPKISRVIE